jgi:hypothetical protein
MQDLPELRGRAFLLFSGADRKIMKQRGSEKMKTLKTGVACWHCCWQG